MKVLSVLFFVFLTMVGLGTVQRPNIVLILADDIGLGDISHHMRKFQQKKPVVETTTLDALAREGLWFTDGHSATALCSPTRYCMMSGNNNYRSYAPWGVWGTFRKTPFKKGEVTLGSVVQKAGYRTGFVGKWHLGGDFRELKSGEIYRSGDSGSELLERVDLTKMVGGGPRDCGFDYDFTVPCGIQGPVYTIYENGVWYPWTKESQIVQLTKDNVRVPKDLTSKGPGPGDSAWDARELGKMISAKAVEFIKGSVEQKKPFFLYYCSHAVHVPHCPPDEFDGVKVKGTTPSPHLDMIWELDLQVKRLVDALKESGVYENTLIVFTSDNGGLRVDQASTKAGHNSSGGWSQSKNFPEEGGHRVPFFAVWKGHIKPGVSDETVINQDMLATLAALVGTRYPASQAQDSHNLLPLLLGQEGYRSRDYLLQQAGSSKEVMFRRMPWKLIMQSNFKRDRFEPKALYHLAENPTENPTKNFIKSPQHQDLIKRLREEYLEIVNSGQRTVPSS